MYDINLEKKGALTQEELVMLSNSVETKKLESGERTLLKPKYSQSEVLDSSTVGYNSKKGSQKKKKTLNKGKFTKSFVQGSPLRKKSKKRTTGGLKSLKKSHLITLN
jgi:hypothetical protein